MRNPIFQDTSGAVRVLHGGSWDYAAWSARVAFRGRDYASLRYDYLGFRIFRTKVES